MNVGGYKFAPSRPKFPERYEEYDVFDEKGQRVAYVRLCRGWLYAAIPDIFGTLIFREKLVYSSEFQSDNERLGYLKRIAREIDFYVGKE